jgi:hypothetical protein
MAIVGGGASSAAGATATIAYQPMTAGLPFEAWVVFGDPNPAVPGYALRSGVDPHYVPACVHTRTGIHAGSRYATAGMAEVEAKLDGGASTTLHVIVGR